MLNIKLVSWSLGVFAAISFVLCVIYGLVTPESIHMHEFLEMALPAFEWLSFWGFMLGLVESFLFGAYAGIVFVPIYNLLYRVWGQKPLPHTGR
ncbi:MAG: hypothetical protein DWQ47_11855 [Acidobacteria bacterium]|nr:MAG: hypothetical protein DWQ32_14270 [Acidobacteriota bacterium]REJ98265.1 MAG: hypothetical protein DWQ38_17070 [Acidobacteriota bacterium]REK17009.1 MAG: hypothetical protein DWQ43_02115 [Acidobacteriota bacterium]REK42919.1 MAG: hypothetical protein DWQ47_11855 [Acidobacteriota bacterium]